MTIEAAGNFEMGLLRFPMAFAALRDWFLHFRRMTGMASQARDAPVFASGPGYVIHPDGMTLHTFFFIIEKFRLGSNTARIKQKRRYSRA